MLTTEQLERAYSYGLCHRCHSPRYSRLERRADEFRLTMLCESGHYADDPWGDLGVGWEEIAKGTGPVPS